MFIVVVVFLNAFRIEDKISEKKVEHNSYIETLTSKEAEIEQTHRRKRVAEKKIEELHKKIEELEEEIRNAPNPQEAEEKAHDLQERRRMLEAKVK